MSKNEAQLQKEVAALKAKVLHLQKQLKRKQENRNISAVFEVQSAIARKAAESRRRNQGKSLNQWVWEIMHHLHQRKPSNTGYTTSQIVTELLKAGYHSAQSASDLRSEVAGCAGFNGIARVGKGLYTLTSAMRRR